MLSLKALSLKAIIDASYKKDTELTPTLLTELADPEVSTYDITVMLCDYINGMKKIGKGKDLVELCTLKRLLQEQRGSYQTLNEKYNKTLNELVEQKRKEVELRMQYDNLEKENAELKNKVRIQGEHLSACGFKTIES